MKVFLFLAALLLSSSVIAQDYGNEANYNDLQSFLNAEKQYRAKKNWGFTFAGAGALLTATGVLFFTQRDGSVDTYPLQDLAGCASIILGGACLGATFPIFNYAKKLKNKKEDLLEKIKA